MILCSLERIETTEKSGPIREGYSTSGWCYDRPAIGRSFNWWSDPIVPEATARLITTSPIVEIREDGTFLTQSGSVYKYEETPSE